MASSFWKRPKEQYVVNYKKMLEGAHLLIGGETGSGKSTVLNGILLTAITTMTPNDAQFVLVDTKEVELTQYKDLPHTVEFIKEASDVPALLDRVCEYMQSEYHRMAGIGIRKSDMPNLYIVIDEIADLMCSEYARDIKRGLQRILQKGRAANIHIIACTQSPSRKTLPAELVINFTDRVALHCASAIESRQILNESGAENIQGYGTILYKAPMKGVTQIRKLPCYSDAEIERRVRYWVDQKPAPRTAPETKTEPQQTGFNKTVTPSVNNDGICETIGSVIASCIMIAIGICVFPIKVFLGMARLVTR